MTNTASTLSPGDDGIAGRTSVIGNYSSARDATLRIDIGGIVAATAFQETGGRHDRLAVTGNANLSGSLRLSLCDGFVPAPADTFTIVSANTINGTFDNANPWGLFTTLDGHSAFALQATATTLVLRDFTQLGDVGLDGSIGNEDIAPFVALLTGGNASGRLGFAADVNGDGAVNNRDIAPFVALLTGGRPIGRIADDPDFAPLLTLVPEPGAMTLLAFLTSAALRRRLRT